MQIPPPTSRPEGNDLLIELVSELYRTHKQQMWSVVFRQLGDIPDLEDLIQQVFEEFYVRFRVEETVANPKAWLFRRLQQRIIDRVRKARTAPIELENVADGLLTDGRLEKDLESGELVQRMLDILDVRERSVLIYIVNGLKYAEIAEALNMSENSVGVYAFRARQKLRKLLEGNSHD